jgi:hypothetical protein
MELGYSGASWREMPMSRGTLLSKNLVCNSQQHRKQKKREVHLVQQSVADSTLFQGSITEHLQGVYIRGFWVLALEGAPPDEDMRTWANRRSGWGSC